VADNNGMGRVFARGKKGKKQTAPWTSYSSRVGGGGLEAALVHTAIGLPRRTSGALQSLPG
jgi:hypothetical protein